MGENHRRDNDRAYGHVFTSRVRAMGIPDRPISPRSPWQNGYAERLIRQPARFLIISLAQTRLAAESPMNQRRIDEHEQSMQLHMWLGAVGESPRYGVEGDLGGPMQGRLMHQIKRPVHQSGKVAFDQHAFPDEETHQTADLALLAERHERTEVSIHEWL